MKLICNNCKTENDLYRLNCIECGALLREKVANIDLFSTIWLLMESPLRGIKKIIFAEHKNYLLPLSILLVIKLLFASFFLQSLLIKPINYEGHFFFNIGIGTGAFLLLLFFFPIFQKIIFKIFKTKSRYKDNLALLVYSQIPLILSLFFILPVQFALFGKYWFFANPSPFIIKETAAYVLCGLDALLFIWSISLFTLSNFVQTEKKLVASAVTFFYLFCLIGLLFLIPYRG